MPKIKTKPRVRAKGVRSASHINHFKVNSVQKKQKFIVVSGFAESSGFKSSDFDPYDS